jgi:hypothetical protein
MAIHQYHYLRKNDRPEEAKEFIANFANKTIHHPSFYLVIKQNIAYPGVMNCLMKLEPLIESNQKKIFERDIQTIRSQLNDHFTKISNTPQEFRVEYQ